MNNFMQSGNLPNLLLTGVPGIGKTTTILAFAHKYYGDVFSDMVLMINASEERGIDTIRKKIEPFVTTKTMCDNTTNLNFKLVIMDETDSMTIDAQAVLRKIIEKYIVGVRFCFICNYLKKISPA